jgi:hypothetical protein
MVKEGKKRTTNLVVPVPTLTPNPIMTKRTVALDFRRKPLQLLT